MSKKDSVLHMIECLSSIPWDVPEWRINDFIENERPAILVALKKRTGQDFGYDYDAWLNWYQEDFDPEQPSDDESQAE